MISIIYPYRDRDLKRIERSFKSLKNQNCQDFEIYFVDYGSEPEFAAKVKKLCDDFAEVKYRYHATRFQPWNKARALNSVIKKLETEFCFVADVDMIFHPDFVKTAIGLQKPKQSVYFQVSFLQANDDPDKIIHQDFSRFRKSDPEATGLTMFPVEILKNIRGFDEFYHFWGAEDTDIHIRLKNAGYQVNFYNEKILMIHQWHKSYRKTEKKALSPKYQLSGIVQMNHQYLQQAIKTEKKVANPFHWGEIQSNEDYELLEQEPVHQTIYNRKSAIEAFVYGSLPGISNRIIKIKFKQEAFQKSIKYQIKKVAGKKIPQYYTLKEINDLLLWHLISIYRDHPYSYKIDTKNGELLLAIKFEN